MHKIHDEARIATYLLVIGMSMHTFYLSINPTKVSETLTSTIWLKKITEVCIAKLRKNITHHIVKEVGRIRIFIYQKNMLGLAIGLQCNIIDKWIILFSYTNFVHYFLDLIYWPIKTSPFLPYCVILSTKCNIYILINQNVFISHTTTQLQEASVLQGDVTSIQFSRKLPICYWDSSKLQNFKN